jgi:hypothetical protein
MLNTKISFFSNRIQIRRGMFFGLLIITALFAFEMFNYSTTDFALTDLLGDLKFLGISWATILAIAFCGIDFAGIARLFTPEQGADEPAEVWYLFGAWMLAALMNAMLTWWGVSIAIINHQTLGNAVVARGTLIKVVPIFVAVMVWLIRVLIIGTMSIAGDRLFSQANVSRSRSSRTSNRPRNTQSRSILPLNNSRTSSIRRGVSASSYQSSPRTDLRTQAEPTYEPLETTYSPVSFSKERSTHTRQARF